MTRGHRSPEATRSRGVRGDGGYSVVEVVLVVPVMTLLTMLVVQYALVWHGRHVAQAAAQDGLRVARAFQSTPAAGGAAARTYLAGVAPNLLRNVDARAEETATVVTVTVDAEVLSLMTFGTTRVSEQASGPREQFVDTP
jgi:Flp pilus assembly protein TadG